MNGVLHDGSRNGYRWIGWATVLSFPFLSFEFFAAGASRSRRQIGAKTLMRRKKTGNGLGGCTLAADLSAERKVPVRSGVYDHAGYFS